MANLTIKIKKEDLNRLRKAETRQFLIDANIYNIHKNKTFKSKKTYTRKSNKIETES